MKIDTKRRISVNFDDELRLFAEADAAEQGLSVQEYLRYLVRERRGPVRLGPPPKPVAMQLAARRSGIDPRDPLGLDPDKTPRITLEELQRLGEGRVSKFNPDDPFAPD